MTMNTFLLVAGVLIMLSVAIAMIRVLRVGKNMDRVMAIQLLGTGGIATLLLFGVVRMQDAAIDVALTLALLTAFAGIAFMHALKQENPEDDDT